MRHRALVLSACLLFGLSAGVSAQFSGPYAPETWTITGVGLGPSSATFAPNGSSLTIVGPDGASGQTDVVHTVVAAGTWSFDWSYTSADTECFDNAYYLYNGTAAFLACSDLFSLPVVGSVNIPVKTGDVIGWRVDSIDGIFGPGTLVITNFQIPAPGAVLLLGLVGISRARRRE